MNSGTTRIRILVVDKRLSRYYYEGRAMSVVPSGRKASWAAAPFG